MTDLPTDEASIERQREIREHWLGSASGAYDVPALAAEVNETFGPDLPIGNLDAITFWVMADKHLVQRFDATWAIVRGAGRDHGRDHGRETNLMAHGVEDLRARVMLEAPRGATVVFTVVTRKV